MSFFKTLFGDGNWQKAGVEAGIELKLRELGVPPEMIKHRSVQGAIRTGVDRLLEKDPTLYAEASKSARDQLEFAIAAKLVEEMGDALNGRGKFAP